MRLGRKRRDVIGKRRGRTGFTTKKFINLFPSMLSSVCFRLPSFFVCFTCFTELVFNEFIG